MSTSPEIKMLAQALYGVRCLLSEYLGSTAAGDIFVRMAAHLSYALHNEALAVLEGRRVDASVALAKVKTVDAMFGSHLAEPMTEVWRSDVASTLAPDAPAVHESEDSATASNMSLSERQVAERYLRECHGAELATLLTEVLAARPETGQEPNVFQDVLVLACAYRERDDTDAWKSWRLAVIGPAAASLESNWHIRAGEPFVQIGRCDQCKLEVHSHAKNATCPVCNVAVYCT